jgi:hypothetical protein
LALKAWLDIRRIQSAAVSAVHDATWWCDMRECYYVPSFALVNASQLMGILLGFCCLSAPALMMLMEGKCELLSWFDFLWIEQGKKTIYLFPFQGCDGTASIASHWVRRALYCRCVFM